MQSIYPLAKRLFFLFPDRGSENGARGSGRINTAIIQTATGTDRASGSVASTARSELKQTVAVL